MPEYSSPSVYRQLHKQPVANISVKPLERVVMHGQTVSLIPIDHTTQATSLYALTHADAAGEHVWDYLAYGPFQNEQALSDWQASLEASLDPLFFAWHDHATNRFTGMGSFMRIEPAARCIEIGHLWMAPVFQNTRAATECLYLMMRHVFEDLGYRRLEWKCDAMNTPSRQAATRLGFSYEGTFYRATIVKGLNRDTAWYSIIDEEWPAINDCFMRWLADDNFDTQGQQNASLQARHANRRPNALQQS